MDGLRDPVASPVVESRPAGFGRILDSFNVPQYRLYWASMMAMMASLHMQMIARAWLVYELTNQVTMLGIVMLSSALPMLFSSLFGGVMADRVQKKRVLLWGQAASALIAFGIAMTIVLDIISLERHSGVGYLLVASAIQGTVMGLMMPARQAMIPEIVGSDRLMNAVALSAAGMNINRLLAPGVAGLLIALAGIQTVYFTMTGLYVLAVVLVAVMRPTGTITLGRKGALEDMKDGLRYVRSNTIVRSILLLTLLAVLFSRPYMALLPVFAKDVQVVGTGQYQWLANIPLMGSVPELLTKSSFRLGLLTSISGVGAVVGSVAVASMRSKNRGRMFLFGILGFGVSLALYAFTSSFTLAFVFMIAVGLGEAARTSLSNTLVQDHTDNEYRGRVMSVYMMEFGLTSLSVFGVSVLASFTGVQWAVGGAALLLIPIALYYFLFVPTIRRLQ